MPIRVRTDVRLPHGRDAPGAAQHVVPRRSALMDEASHKTEVGDLVVIAGHRVGEQERIGEILEVLGAPSHERYRVRWDDGHESLFYPGSDATIRHATRPGASTRRVS
jgi:hypothetical protein